MIWLYGHHAVEAALNNSDRICHRLMATEEALSRLTAHEARPGLAVTKASRSDLDHKLGENVVHQGLALAVAPLPARGLKEACMPNEGRNLVLVLDQISDPQNLGAILRSAAAFNVVAVLLPNRHSAELGGTVAKAASGALDLVPLVETANLAQSLDALKELGYWRVALDGAAGQSLEEAPDLGNYALVLGAEGRGLRRLVKERCDLSLSLPIAASMESLNVSVACGIALYALTRSPQAAGSAEAAKR